jgi:hypothetical protein
MRFGIAVPAMERTKPMPSGEYIKAVLHLNYNDNNQPFFTHSGDSLRYSTRADRPQRQPTDCPRNSLRDRVARASHYCFAYQSEMTFARRARI